jgi:hypothetical protein
MAHRNRYLEGTDNGQMTPRGYPNFDSYIKKLRILVFMTDREINPGGARTLIAHRLEEFLVVMGNSFWCYLSTSCAALSVLWLWQEIVFGCMVSTKNSYWVS